MTADRTGPGRPRAPRTEQQITEATLALLRESGPSAVSIAAVAHRSGVARTTIYRRFSDRRELLAAALGTVTAQGTPPGHLDVPDKVAWVLARSTDVLRDGIGPGGLAAVLTESDTEFSLALRAALEAGLVPLRSEVATEIERGVLAADLDPDLMLTVMLGAYVAEWLRHGPPTEERLDQIATALSRVLTP